MSHLTLPEELLLNLTLPEELFLNLTLVVDVLDSLTKTPVSAAGPRVGVLLFNN